MLPAVLFLGAAGVVQAALQARGRFAFTALSAAGFNAGIIVVGLALGPTLGPPALALGVVVGAALQLVVQWPGLRDVFAVRPEPTPSSGHPPADADPGAAGSRAAVGLRLRPDWRHPAVGRALRLYAPVAAGLVLTQVGIVIDRYLAWTTGEASIALMHIATTLVQLPLGLVATALSFAVLPSLSRALDDDEFRRTLSFGLRLALLLVVPTTLGLILLREPVLRLLFERGAFTAEDTILTGRAFVWYAPQMPFWAVDQLIVFAFYARRDTRTPVLVGVFGTLLYLAVALATVAPLGVFGLILANTLQNSAHCLVMLYLIGRRLPGLADRELVGLLARIALATAGAWAAHAAALAILGPSPPGQSANLAWLAATGAAMALAGLAVLAALRTPELVALADAARRRLRAPSPSDA
jgi:putative peptidoglycan lipid II flippase